MLLDKRLRQEEEGIAAARRDHEAWLKQLQGAGAPYLRLVAVFSGE